MSVCCREKRDLRFNKEDISDGRMDVTKISGGGLSWRRQVEGREGSRDRGRCPGTEIQGTTGAPALNSELGG